MATVTGRFPALNQGVAAPSTMTLSNFRDEMRARGFSGLDATSLDRYINWGYFEVARKAKWFWEIGEVGFTLAPGEAWVDMKDLGGVRSIREVHVTSAGYEKPLKRMSNEEYRENYASLPITSGTYRGEPASWILWEEQLVIWPPPEVTRTFIVGVYFYVTPLVAEGQVPITPVDMDEAIILAALRRAHVRVQEPGLAEQRRADAAEIYNDNLNNEVMRDEEFQWRVEPDDTWL